jgi:hypothetical protein
MPDVGKTMVEFMKVLEEMKSNDEKTRTLELCMGNEGQVKLKVEIELEPPRLRLVKSSETS